MINATESYDGLVLSEQDETALYWIRDNHAAVDRRFGPEYCEPRYDVMIEPRRSDVSTRVPSGSFDEFEDAQEYLYDVVLDELDTG